MSPEQIQGQRLTVQSDLFSSGMVMYELFAGKMLFSGSDIGETLNNILRVNSAAVMDAASDLPLPMPQVLPALLTKNPDDRPERAGHIIAEYFPEFDLKPIGKAARWRLRPVMIAAAIFSLMLFSTAVFYAFQSKVEQQVPPNSITPAVQAPGSDALPVAADSEATTELHRPAETVGVITKPEQSNKDQLPETASLAIATLPQALVVLDGRDISAFSQKNEPITIAAGDHRLDIQHDDFPRYTTTIKILPGEDMELLFELDKLFGYLDCKVHPWADIYIDGAYRGQTPMRELLMLSPGTYQLELRNPGFFQSSAGSYN